MGILIRTAAVQQCHYELGDHQSCDVRRARPRRDACSKAFVASRRVAFQFLCIVGGTLAYVIL